MGAIIQGTIQGLTEFLPISSSGHLVLFSYLFGLRGDLPFVALLHLGTFFAVLIFTSKKILYVLMRPKIILMLIISTIPAGIVWVLFKDAVEKSFNAKLLPLTFSITASFLLLASVVKGNKKMDDMGIVDALIIGIAQAFALLPGISRSGMTISAALLLGYEAEDSIYYSFLLSLPTTFAGGILNIEGAGAQGILGLIFSFAFGLLALFLVKKAVKTGEFHLFSYYLSFVAFLSYFGVIS
jgi:undecaprenyl-diphosphatase